MSSQNFLSLYYSSYSLTTGLTNLPFPIVPGLAQVVPLKTLPLLSITSKVSSSNVTLPTTCAHNASSSNFCIFFAPPPPELP